MQKQSRSKIILIVGQLYGIWYMYIACYLDHFNYQWPHRWRNG